MSNKIIIRVPKHKKAVRKYEFLPEIWDRIKAYLIVDVEARYRNIARIGIPACVNMFATQPYQIFVKGFWRCLVRRQDQNICITRLWIMMPQQYKAIFEHSLIMIKNIERRANWGFAVPR